MIKAVVVDDEKKICSLILKLGAWEENEVEVLGLYSNGQEAYDAILKLKPQLILTDIKIPIFDGLELIHKVKEAGIHAEFIVISGYGQFEYARKAIQYDVVDFILKPIDEGLLNRAIASACGRIHNKLQHRIIVERAEQLSEKNRQLMAQKLIASLIHSSESRAINAGSVQDDLPAVNSAYDMAFQHGIYQAQIINFNSENGPKLRAVVWNTLADEFTHTFTDCHEALCVQEKDMDIVVLLNYSEEQKKAVERNMLVFFNAVERMCSSYDNAVLSSGVGCPVQSLRNYALSYEAAVKAERCKIITGSKRLFYYEKDVLPALRQERSGCLERIGNPADMPDYKSLKLQLEQLNIAAVTQWFDAQAHVIYGPAGQQPDYVYPMRDQILAIYAEFKNKNHLHEDMPEQLYYQTNHRISGPQILKCLKTALLSTCSEFVENMRNKEEYPVRVAMDYISRNYDQPLTIEDTAQVAGVSTVTLGRLLKNETGRTFITYLTDYRMEKSRELLREGGRTIAQVARAVGYEDEKYFSRLFKKQYGLKPSEYRRLYL